MVHRAGTYFLTFLFCFFSVSTIQAQTSFDDIVQINGVTMTADSLRAVPGVVVLVKNKNRGVESSNSGVFSIVVYKGDTLQFTALGFRTKEYVVPQNVEGQYFSMIQLMVQDTFYLPETIIRPYPSREAFNYAFVHERLPDDQYEIARKNVDALTLRALAYLLPKDGRENQAAYQGIQRQQAVYYGQQQPLNILSPLAWAEFFEAWKRGDFRKKY
jgi:hypothetical protein